MENVAVIDIGSNTIRLCVYAIKGDDFALLAKKRSVAGLASYVNESDKLNEDGIEKLIEVLQGFVKFCAPYNVTKVLPFATASLRLIKNQKAVVKRIRLETGLEVKIISGGAEAGYSFSGAMHCLNEKEGLLIDIGGASTELVYFRNQRIIKSYSFPLGSLSAYEKHVRKIVPTSLEQEKIKRDILEFLDGTNIPDSALGSPLCGVGGSIRNTFKIYQNIYKEKNPKKMNFEKVRDMLKLFKTEKKENLDIVLKIAPHRIHTIIPGMIILKTIAKYFKCSDIFVSKFGIREGYLMQNIRK